MFISVINYRFRQIASNIKRGGGTLFHFFSQQSFFLNLNIEDLMLIFFYFYWGGGHIANCREMNKSNVKV